MADFPSIEPFRRSYSLPVFPLEQEESWPGIATRYKTGRRGMASGVTISLTYEDIREADMQRIRNHWRSQMGGVIGFNVPAVVWGGAGSLPLGGLRFRYTSPPEETQKKGGWYDVTIDLESFSFAAAFLDAPMGAIIATGLPPSITTAGAVVTSATASIAVRGFASFVTSAANLVTLPRALPIVTRGIAPDVGTQGSGTPVARVVVRGPDPVIGPIPGGLVVATAGRVRLAGVAPTWTQSVVFRQPPAGPVVTRGVAPTVSLAGAVQIPPPGPVKTRGRVPTFSQAGGAGTPSVARVVTRGQVAQASVIAGGVVLLAAGRVVTRGQVAQASVIAGGVVLLAAGRVVTRGRVPTFSQAGGVVFPAAGRSVIKGRVPTVTGG